MTIEVMAVVLCSALLHAGWNALVRVQPRQVPRLAARGLRCRPPSRWCCCPGCRCRPRRAGPGWCASALIHVVYFTLVARAYHGAELGFAYPLMRGTAPALTALAAALLLGEVPTPVGWLGIALICSGVLALAGRGWRSGASHPGAVLAALANAGVIALYTLVDGQGVRLSGHALSYTGWVFLLSAVLLLATAGACARPRACCARQRAPGAPPLLGGAGTLAAYSLVLWAMAQAPIAAVAALRETSIVFAALIGALFLHEGLGRLRLFSTPCWCVAVPWC